MDKTRDDPSCSRRESSSCFLLDNAMLIVFSSPVIGNSVVRDRGKHYIKGKRSIAILNSTKERHYSSDRRGRDRMVVGFTTTYAISAYHH